MLYEKEASQLLQIISTYKALKSKQVYAFFQDREKVIEQLLKKYIKQKRIYYDDSLDLITYSANYKENKEIINSVWVLLDFIENIEFHTIADYPATICFFTKNEVYEIVFVGYEKETIINFAFTKSITDFPSKKIMLVEDKSQIPRLKVDNIAGYCTVDENGKVNYYQLK